MALSILAQDDQEEELFKIDWKANLENFHEQNDEIQALESYFYSTENFEILERSSLELDQLYSLQFKIQVNAKNAPNEKFKAEIWLPIEETSTSEQATSKQAKATFERSISGRNAFTTVECSYLPFILMDATLPCSYPSLNMPIYQVKSNWLNLQQLDRISNKLEEIWKENYNMPVLFTWIEWLQNELLEYLDIFELNRAFITPIDTQQQAGEIRNKNIVSLYIGIDDLIYQLLRHNHVEESKHFRRTNQNCMICFDEKLGSEFYRLNECKHHFCAECLTNMCQIHVKEGTIQLLKCPDNDCKEFVPIEIMRQTLTGDEFERWQRLLLQRTLDSMTDIIYCPKCSNPVIVDDDSHTFCMICNLDFCRSCKNAWHPGACEKPETKLANKLKSFNLTMNDLLKMTDEQIRERFQSNSVAILSVKKEATKTTEKELVEKFMAKYIPCPKCKSPIDKFEGCNKVVCICGTILCYICGKIITGYDHFSELNSKCNLWSNQNAANRVPERPVHEAQRALERVLAAAPEQRRNTMNCPSCGQTNLKTENNNHLRCWLCSTHFCFCCKKRIIGNVTNHYKSGSACKQHGEVIVNNTKTKNKNKNNNDDEPPVEDDYVVNK